MLINVASYQKNHTEHTSEIVTYKVINLVISTQKSMFPTFETEVHLFPEPNHKPAPGLTLWYLQSVLRFVRYILCATPAVSLHMTGEFDFVK